MALTLFGDRYSVHRRTVRMALADRVLRATRVGADPFTGPLPRGTGTCTRSDGAA
jgi:hypothetical protein